MKGVAGYGSSIGKVMCGVLCLGGLVLLGCAQVDPIDMSRKISAESSTAIQPISDKILAGGDVVQRKEVHLEPAKPANPGLGWGLLAAGSGGVLLAGVMVGKLIRKHAGVGVSCDRSRNLDKVAYWEDPGKDHA